MQGNSKRSPGQEEVKVNIFMWKVMIIICTLGNPCSVFEQDPVVYHNTKAECIVVAQEKEALLLGSFMEIGFIIETSEVRCDNTSTGA